MATQTASGQASGGDVSRVVRDAVTQAQGRLGAPATVGFVFAASALPFDEVMRVAQACLPGCALLGCQTAGEFTEAGRTRGGVAVLLTTLEPRNTLVAEGQGMRHRPLAVAHALTADFKARQFEASRRGASHSTSVLLLDGLASTGEMVVKEVLRSTRMFQQIVGGAAADAGRFEQTLVGTGQGVMNDGAVALHTFSSSPWGVGVEHGLVPNSRPMWVTRAHGTTVFEIDRQPAFEVYRSIAHAQGVTLTRENAVEFMLTHELGVLFLNDLHHARAPIGVGPSGELQLVAEVPQGSQVCVLQGRSEAMIHAAHRAAEHARQGLEGHPAAGVLVFDCVCRGMILRDEFEREIEAVRKVFPGVPVAGFLTYGEVARFRGKLDGWHNTTAVVVAIPS